MEKKYTHKDLMAAHERMGKALKAWDKHKKAHDKAESHMNLHSPEYHKVLNKYKAADQEASDATAHVVHVMNHMAESVEIQERGNFGIDATPKKHGGIKPGDKVEHPEHGSGVVQHLDHVHDEVVYKNHQGDFIGAHHSTLKKLSEATEPGKDASHFDHYLYHFRKSLDNMGVDPDKVKHHRAEAQKHIQLHTKRSRAGTKPQAKETVRESMDKNQIVQAILSKDANRLAEAKVAIKALLDTRAAQFRADSTKFVARSLFEAAEQVDEAVHNLSGDHHEEALKIMAEHGTKPEPHKDGGHHNVIHQFSAEDAHDDFHDAGWKHKKGTYTKGKTKVTVTQHSKDHEGFDRLGYHVKTSK